MAIADDSFLPEYFTEERLAELRELHARYFMWCGVWPWEKRDLREYAPWDPHQRISDHARVGDAAPLVLWQPPGRRPSAEFIPRPLRLFMRAPEGGSNAPDVVLSAVFYASYPWHLPQGQRDGEADELGPEGMLRRWSGLLEASLCDLSDERLSSPERHFGLELAHKRDQVLGTSGPTRAGHNKDLKKTWEQLGREIGVIPSIGQGTVLRLRGEPLETLLTQGTELIGEATAFQPSDEDLRETSAAVRGLRGLSVVTVERLASLRRQGAAEDADRSQGEGQLAALGEDEASLSATWLRFPILNRDEIRLVRERPRRDSEVSYSLALDFILSRWAAIGLSLDRTTVQKARAKSGGS